MKIQKISTVFFSPTESTKNVLSMVTNSFPLPTEAIDITNFSEKDKSCNFASDELVIFGVPVYVGRMPVPAMERMQNMHGNQTPAILIVTYGNRDYDDALLELKNLAEKNGFVTVAAAAFITEHSIMHSVAYGRPDADDKSKILNFANKIWAKIENAGNAEDFSPIAVKGNTPYKEYSSFPLNPKSTSACNKCGICAANCPVNAIPAAEPNKTNKDACIRCMRCIKVCPLHARKLNGIIFPIAEKAFAKKCSARREPEIFI